MKTAIVTGAASGIGKATYEALRAAGWMVYSLDKRVGVDVRDYYRVRNFIKDIGKFDLLVNNAGIAHKVEFENFNPDLWHETIGTNLTGVYNCCHAALPYLHGGDIINISSRSGVYAHEKLAAYCASKAGVMMFSEALGLELRKFGIRVGYIMPGIVNTAFCGDPLRDWHVGPEDVASTVMHMISLPRRAKLGRVEILPAFPGE